MTSWAVGTSATSLSGPTGVAIDGNGGLYVADYYNNRVLYYARASTKASRVLGQLSMTSSAAFTGATGLNGPMGVAVDGSGGLYVADSGNNRVLYYPTGSTTASVVYGQPNMTSHGRGTGASGLDDPSDVAVDGRGGLYVADSLNNRVLYLSPPRGGQRSCAHR